MNRFSVLIVVTCMAVLALAPSAESTHEWGHRYMIFGRILDANGEPAQQIPVRITVETTMPSDPWMIVTTDCSGLYYSLERTGDPSRGGGLEAGRMHIHNADLPSDGKYTVQTDHGTKSGTVRAQLKYSTVNLELDQPVEKSEQCTDIADWTTRFAVAGHAQRDKGNERTDIQTVRIPDRGVNITEQVTVTLETTNGTVNKTQEINAYGDYFVFFEDVEVERGAEVTVRWNDETRTDTVSASEARFRVAEVNMVVEEGVGGTAVKVLLWVLGIAAVVAIVAFGVTKGREAMETKRIRQSGTRKRANR